MKSILSHKKIGSVSYKFALRFSGPTFFYQDQNDLDQKRQDLQSTVASEKVKVQTSEE